MRASGDRPQDERGRRTRSDRSYEMLHSYEAAHVKLAFFRGDELRGGDRFLPGRGPDDCRDAVDALNR